MNTTVRTPSPGLRLPAPGVGEGHAQAPRLRPLVGRSRLDSSREGMLPRISLGSYLLLVDYTGRLNCDSKSKIRSNSTQQTPGVMKSF
jgi:hypothetical protein